MSEPLMQLDGSQIPVPPAIAEPAGAAVDAREPLRRNRYLGALRTSKGRLSLVLILGLVAVALIAPLFLISPTEQSASSLSTPGGAHLLGTDELGRDIFSRLVNGIRTDLVITLIAVPIAAVAGTLLGLIGIISRPLGNGLQRLFDVLLGVPVIILGIGLAFGIGPGDKAIIAAVVLATLPTFGRQAHASLNAQLGREYVTAAIVIGTPRRKLLTRHILPNVVDAMFALAAVSMSLAITIEGGLSVMGLGVVPPQPSLGSMIRDGSPYLFQQPQYALAPVVVVTLLVLGYTLLADVLNGAVLRK